MVNINPDTCHENQGFGVNHATYAPLKGHTGIDLACGYGTPIHAPADMFIYKVLTPENPSNDGSGFTGVFGIVDDGIESYELLIGHCHPLVSEGTLVVQSYLIGTEANHGLVFDNGIQITLEMQKNGDHRGAHRHIQKRPVFKTPTIAQPALSAHNDVSGTYRDPEGFYYQIFNYTNGFNGCIDPTKSIFERDLTLGSQGYDVFVLQRILSNLGHPVPTTSYFGPLTKAALTAFQANAQIEPDLGYFGPLTRTHVQQIYGV